MPVTTPVTTTRFGIYRWPSATDSFTRAQMNTSHEQIELWGATIRTGASNPTGAEYVRAFFYNTAENALYYSPDGSDWKQVTGYGTPSTQAIGDSAVEGSAKTFARSDHKHAMPSFGTTTAAVGTTASGGSATTLARADHVHIVGSEAVGTAQLKTDVAGTGLSHTPGSGITTASTYRLARAKTTAPTEGTIAAGDVWTDTSTAGKEGLYVRSTSTWQRPWNLPWGMLARTFLPLGSQSGITTETDISVGGTALQANFTAVAGRAYRVTAYVSNVAAAAAPTFLAADLRIKIGTTVYGRNVSSLALDNINGNAFGTTMRAEAVIEGLAAGSTTFKATIQPVTYSSLVVTQSNTLIDRSYLVIEDIGPSLA